MDDIKYEIQKQNLFSKLEFQGYQHLSWVDFGFCEELWGVPPSPTEFMPCPVFRLFLSGAEVRINHSVLPHILVKGGGESYSLS